MKEGWEWQKEPVSLSSVFAWVRSAGEENIKVETLLLKLGNVKEASATSRIEPHTRTQQLLPYNLVK